MWIYFIVMNITGFLSMGIDKRKAIKHNYRIPEATLLLIALVGGSLGSYLGMYVFHHKTKHIKFYLGVPLIILGQVAFYIFVFNNFLK